MKLLFLTCAHYNHVKMVEHVKGQEKRDKTIRAHVHQVSLGETAL